MDSLFSLAHRLLTYGLDGSPIYVDEFTRLNREVYEQAFGALWHFAARLLSPKLSFVLAF